jgi:O-antigen/teichoic acid export membrane protein
MFTFFDYWITGGVFLAIIGLFFPKLVYQIISQDNNKNIVKHAIKIKLQIRIFATLLLLMNLLFYLSERQIHSAYIILGIMCITIFTYVIIDRISLMFFKFDISDKLWDWIINKFKKKNN